MPYMCSLADTTAVISDQGPHKVSLRVDCTEVVRRPWRKQFSFAYIRPNLIHHSYHHGWRLLGCYLYEFMMEREKNGFGGVMSGVKLGLTEEAEIMDGHLPMIGLTYLVLN